MNRLAAAAAATALLAASVLGGAPPAVAAPSATVLGETAASPVVTCGGDVTVIQGAAAPTGASYTTPGAGVITAFAVQTNPNPGGQVRLGLFGTPTGGVFPVQARSATFALVASTLNTYAVRVPVQAGWLIGARFTGMNMACGVQTFTAADDFYTSGTDIDGASVSAVNLGDFHVNLRAVWEPDGDGDGYGDVSQDACPQSAVSHDPCIPDTAVTKAPPKRSTHRKVKVEFTSTVAGSTFTCSLDGKAAKPCSSPYKLRVKVGKHTLSVTATSPAGVVDASPAVVRFKVKPRPR